MVRGPDVCFASWLIDRLLGLFIALHGGRRPPPRQGWGRHNRRDRLALHRRRGGGPRHINIKIFQPNEHKNVASSGIRKTKRCLTRQDNRMEETSTWKRNERNKQARRQSSNRASRQSSEQTSRQASNQARTQASNQSNN